MNSRFFRGPLSCWGVDALFDVLVGLVLVGLVVGLVADVRPDSRPEHPPGLRGDRDEFAVSHPEDGSLLGMVSTSPLRSSGGKGGAMGARHDADVDAVAVADRDDDAIMPLRPAAAMYSLPSDPRELEFFSRASQLGCRCPPRCPRE